MTNSDAQAKLRAFARAARVEAVASELAAALDALPEKYPPDLLEDALTRALALHMTLRFEAYRRAADTPMDTEKPHE